MNPRSCHCKRVLIANAANAGGDFQQRIQVAGPPRTGRKAGDDFFRTQVERIFSAKQKRRTVEFGGVSELDRILVEVVPTFLDQEDEH